MKHGVFPLGAVLAFNNVAFSQAVQSVEESRAAKVKALSGATGCAPGRCALCSLRAVRAVLPADY